jgi:hypothetical protein
LAKNVHPAGTRRPARAHLTWRFHWAGGRLFGLTSPALSPSLDSIIMKLDTSIKHFVLAFLLAAICYAVFYRNIENRRIRKGPWQVTFTTNAVTSTPLLVINQPMLHITNVLISFVDEAEIVTNSVVKMAFSQPRPVPYELPFGRCIFMDTTFLPGTVVFELFGHRIELLPRVLIIDSREHLWSSIRFTLHSQPKQDPQPPP